MEEKQSNGLAIASMVLGIVSLILTCILPYVSWVLAIVGIVLAAIAKKRQNQEWLQLVLYALSSH
jgi:predicted membrane channel-forming protein YqfA (hemolysin III family)